MGLDNASDIQAFLKTNGISGNLEKIEKYLKIINPPESLTGLDSDYKTYQQLIKDKNPDVKNMTWLEYKQMIYNLEHPPAGDAGQFKQFFPDVDLTTPAGQQQFLDWKERMAEAGREPTESDLLKFAFRDMNTKLDSVKGDDGFISPDDWNEAKNLWINKGLKAEDFIKQFSDYINPAHPQDYGTREMNYIRRVGEEIPLNPFE